MASLTGNQINNTYQGLLKFTDNAGVSGTPKDVTDGLGAGLPLSVATDRINFTDTIDFTNATIAGTSEGIGSEQNGSDIIIYANDVNGSPSTVQLVAGTNITLTNNFDGNFTIEAAGGGGGSAGLINDPTGGINTFVSAPGLSTNPAVALSPNTLAIGNGAEAGSAGQISIGLNSGNPATSGQWGSISIGNDSYVNGFGCIAIGGGAVNVNGNSGIAIGDSSIAKRDGTAIGRDAHSNQVDSICIGSVTTSNNFATISIGQNLTMNGEDSGTFGTNTTNNGSNSFTFGNGHSVGSGNSNNVILGGSGISIPGGTNDFISVGRVNSPSGTSYNSVSIGLVSQINNSNDAVAIGRGATCLNAGNSVAVGYNAQVSGANNAVALGAVTHTRSSFAGVQELEVHTVGGGIIMPSPDGTLYKLTIANGGTVTVSAV